MKGAASLALAFCLLFAALFPCELSVFAKEKWPEGPKLSGKNEAAILMEMDSMAILYGKHAKQKHFPASITKVMTALVAIENGNLKDTVKFSHFAVFAIEPGSAHIARDEGEKMSLKNCLYALMLESANECANAIAEHVGGDYDSFIKMMNKKAKELGCVNTHFANPHGLHEEDHYTCAYDMALIARAAYQNKTFRKIVGTDTYYIPPTNKHAEKTILNNHHAMLHVYKTSKYLYDFCTGGKTGYTTQAQNTLVSFAEKDGQSLVCVVMNAGQTMHYNDTRALFEWGFANFHTVDISAEKAPLAAGDAAYASIFEGRTATLPSEIKLRDTLASPIEPEDDVYSDVAFLKNIDGVMEYSYADTRVGSAPYKLDIPEEVLEQEKREEASEDGLSEGIRRRLLIGGIAAVVFLGLLFLLFIRHLYVAAPYNQYYDKPWLKRHFERKRRKRLRKIRKRMDDKWGL